MHRASLDEVRAFFAKMMASASGSLDPRLERIFELIPREAFVSPGPWKLVVGERYVDTPSADPAFLYQNHAVALDAARGINNGEPLLHAEWIGRVAPQPGDSVTQIGVGTGYYSAILSMLVLPGGRLLGIERDAKMVEAARRNLEPFENVTVIEADAVTHALPPSDVIYVSAGAVAPPARWLDALKPGGRLIFPWRPSADIALAVLVTSTPGGLGVEPLMNAWFIPCFGATEAGAGNVAPSHDDAWRSRSIHLTRDRAPDATATAVYRHVWFSSEPAACAGSGL